MKKQAAFGPSVAVLFAISTLLIFHNVIFRPGTIFGMDIVTQGYPFSWYFSHAVQSGVRPDWFPYMMSGFPLTSAIPLYPLDWLCLTMPLPREMTWRYIIHIFGAAVFMYMLMRRFGRSNTGSIIGGMAFGFSAFFISKIYAGHGGAIWSGVWIPLTFLFLDKAVETRQFRYAALTGVVLGFQLLGLHPQYVYYTGLAMAIFFIWRVLPMVAKERKLNLVPVYAGLAVIAFLFTFFISSPYILQFLESTALSNRGGGTDYSFASSFSLAPAQLVTAIAPSFWGSPVQENSAFGALYWDGSMFIGILPFILAIIAFFGMRDSRAGYFKALAILSILIALGDYTPFFKLIYKIPGFSMIRAPSKILYLYTFAMAGLAAYGTDIVISSSVRLRSPRLAAIEPETQNAQGKAVLARKVMAFSFLAVIISLVAWWAAKGIILSHAERIIGSTRSNPEAVMGKLAGLYAMQLSGLAWTAALIALGTLAVTALTRKWISLNAAATALIALSFIDLWFYADPLLFTTNARKFYTSGDRMAINIIKADSDRFRILPMDTDSFQYAQGVFDGLESVNGYYPTSIGRYAAYAGAIQNTPAYVGVSADITRHDSPLVGLLNVKYVLSTKRLTGSHLAEIHAGKSFVYYNRNWLPRVFTVHSATLAESPDAALKEIKEPDFDPKKTIILENRNVIRRVPGNPAKDRAVITSYSDTRLDVKADMASNGYLFFSEVYYPRWQAWVDGKPVKVLCADYLFRAVYLPKGKHDIRMEYVNTPYRTGMILYFSSLAFIAGMLIVRRKQRD
ncbi:MAG: YfhO family protein [Armatimonadota bacterium]